MFCKYNCYNPIIIAIKKEIDYHILKLYKIRREKNFNINTNLIII